VGEGVGVGEGITVGVTPGEVGLEVPVGMRGAGLVVQAARSIINIPVYSRFLNITIFII
jgi:hypothetical protein